MKKMIVVVIFLIIGSGKVSAMQDSLPKASHWLQAYFTQNYVGKNLGLAYMFQWNKQYLRAGIKIHLNNNEIYNHNASNETSYQRGYAQNFRQHLGVNLGYQYAVLNSPKKGSISIQYDMELSYFALRSAEYEYVGIDSLGMEYYKKYHVLRFPKIAIDQTIGIAGRTRIGENIFLEAALGMGISLSYHNEGTILEIENSRLYMLDNQYQKYGFFVEYIGLAHFPMFRLGLSYKFPKLR